jgi:hypothetical protein
MLTAVLLQRRAKYIFQNDRSSLPVGTSSKRRLLLVRFRIGLSMAAGQVAVAPERHPS